MLRYEYELCITAPDYDDDEDAADDEDEDGGSSFVQRFSPSQSRI